MALKRMAEFKRDDYSYESPDGDQWEITLIQTADRKYVEIKKGNDAQVQWDIEMLLDIADAVRTLSYLFGTAVAPPEPFAACGTDPVSGALGCDSFPPCGDK